MKGELQLLARALLATWPRCCRCGGYADYRPRDARFAACWCETCVRAEQYPGMRDALDPIGDGVSIEELEWVASDGRLPR